MFALGWLVTYFMINSTLVGSNSSCFICWNNLFYFMCLLCELPEIRVMSCNVMCLVIYCANFQKCLLFYVLIV
ncbi:hypothetical protein NC652_004438 [Populus alba x Populus x berolinensis]|nr:hypothetical protein NC652_004438 [Populus alba x Populus x berolinensis]